MLHHGARARWQQPSAELGRRKYPRLQGGGEGSWQQDLHPLQHRTPCCSP